MTISTCDIRKTIEDRFGGVVKSGGHAKGGCSACILEALSVCKGIEWTSSPEVLGVPDIRPINDAPWSSDAIRTEHMLRLLEAVLPWARWSATQRQVFAEQLAVLTVQETVANLPHTPEEVRKQCRQATTTEAARAAADAAILVAPRGAELAAAASAEAAAEAAAWANAKCPCEAAPRAAEAAAWAADAAARAAGAAARWARLAASSAADVAVWAAADASLIQSVNLWIAAAEYVSKEES